ncbi:hypothetical protein SAMN06265360_10234 [Haloechinothrix alba]|uniref:Lipoprotein n=1 Tax=Haloechinothrix alba TaxID=664784 RepID=A0A238VC93_9PSEU|nr:hypothetical protein [Haloechinothrix alba]SNR31841.1 hypothetical protein SAMN06265360_10234 [Haloechinothrix alba]
MRKPFVTTGAVACAMVLGACNGGAVGQGSSAFTDVEALAGAAGESTAEHNSASFTMNMDMGMMAMEASGEGRFEGADTAMAMTMNAMDMDFEVRLIDETMYMKMPDMPEGMGSGPGMQADPDKPWIEMPLGDSPMMDEALIEQNDPRHMIELLQESGEITDTDEDAELDGESATYYAIDVDAEQLVERYAADLSGELGDEMSGVELGTLPIELWMNDDDLPLRFVADMGPFMQAMAEQQGEDVPPEMAEATMTMTYSDWGEPVEIEAPPEDQVGEMPQPEMGGAEGFEDLEEPEE